MLYVLSVLNPKTGLKEPKKVFHQDMIHKITTQLERSHWSNQESLQWDSRLYKCLKTNVMFETFEGLVNNVSTYYISHVEQVEPVDEWDRIKSKNHAHPDGVFIHHEIEDENWVRIWHKITDDSGTWQETRKINMQDWECLKAFLED